MRDSPAWRWLAADPVAGLQPACPLFTCANAAAEARGPEFGARVAAGRFEFLQDVAYHRQTDRPLAYCSARMPRDQLAGQLVGLAAGRPVADCDQLGLMRLRKLAQRGEQQVVQVARDRADGLVLGARSWLIIPVDRLHEGFAFQARAALSRSQPSPGRLRSAMPDCAAIMPPHGEAPSWMSSSSPVTA